MFKQFSKIDYNLNGQTLNVVDIFKSINVDTSNFTGIRTTANNEKYRPDQLSQTIYNNTNLYWSFFLLNNIKNPFKQWAQSEQSVIDQNSEEYKYWYLQFANNSTYIPTNSNAAFSETEIDIYDGVDFSGITLGDIAIYESGDGYFKLKAFGAGGLIADNSFYHSGCRAPHYKQSVIPDNFTVRNTVFTANGGGNVSAAIDGAGRIWAWGQPIGLTTTSEFTNNSGLYRSATAGYTLLNVTKNKIIASKGTQWYCYGDGCTTGLSYPVTVSAGIKKMAFTKGNTFAGIILGNDNKITTYGGLTSTLGYTGTYLSGQTYSDIGCLENNCFGIIFNGTDYSGSIIDFNYPGVTSSIKPNILQHHIALGVDARISELASPQQDLYTLQGHTLGPNGTYTRNTNHWLYKKNTTLGITGVDLTGISPWNSTVPIGPNQDQWGFFNTGTAITPWHFITAAHYLNGEGTANGFSIGDTIRFVTNDNQVVVRTVTDFRFVPGDIQICKMDAALPPSISYHKVPPSATPSGLLKYTSLYTSTPNFDSINRRNTIPIIVINQQEKAGIYPAILPVGFSSQFRYYDSTSIRNSYDILLQSGDSSSAIFYLINNELIINGMLYGGGGGIAEFDDENTQTAMNAAMAEMGPAGISLTTADFSSFTPATGYDFSQTIKLGCGISHGMLIKNEYTSPIIYNNSKSCFGFGDNSKNQLNLITYKHYNSVDCGEYHTVAIDTNNTMETAGKIAKQNIDSDCNAVYNTTPFLMSENEWEFGAIGYPSVYALGGYIGIGITAHSFTAGDRIRIQFKEDPEVFYTGDIDSITSTTINVTYSTDTSIYPYNFKQGQYRGIWQLISTTPPEDIFNYTDLQKIPGKFASISSGHNHIVALGGQDVQQHIGEVAEIDNTFKRIGLASYTAPDGNPVLFDNAGGSYVSFWRDGKLVKSIQHQLNSIDSYLNTTQYIKDADNKIIDLMANNEYYWRNLFITTYKTHKTNSLFVTPLKLQTALLEGKNNIKYVTNEYIYALERTLNAAVKTQNKVDIKLSDL